MMTLLCPLLQSVAAHIFETIDHLRELQMAAGDAAAIGWPGAWHLFDNRITGSYNLH
jgi:hypothetical protein